MKMRVLLTLCLPLFCATLVRGLDPKVEQKIEETTVRIFTKAGDNAFTGSGFLIGDGNYVVTNHHVIANADQILIVSKSMHRLGAQIVIDSPQKDLAVLRLDGNVSRPAAALVLSSGVEKSENIWAAGFPAAADDQGDNVDNLLEVKLSTGIISANVRLSSGVAAYQISAPINPGNSGGPLFDECGRVAGINVEKSLIQAVVEGSNGQPTTERVPLGEGIAWSIKADELADLLNGNNIHAQIDTTPCNPENTSQQSESVNRANVPTSNSSSIPPQSTTTPQNQGSSISLPMLAMFIGVPLVVIAIIAVIIFAVRSSKPSVVNSPAQAPQPPTNVAATLPARAQGAALPYQLRGLTGTFSNMVFPLSQGAITMGRNPQVAQIVFQEKDRLISKRHCVLRLDHHAGGVLLEDCNSRNGTYLDNGEKLRSGEPHLLRPGGRFYLGNRSYLFQVD